MTHSHPTMFDSSLLTNELSNFARKLSEIRREKFLTVCKSRAMSNFLAWCDLEWSMAFAFRPRFFALKQCVRVHGQFQNLTLTTFLILLLLERQSETWSLCRDCRLRHESFKSLFFRVQNFCAKSFNVKMNCRFYV